MFHRLRRFFAAADTKSGRCGASSSQSRNRALAHVVAAACSASVAPCARRRRDGEQVEGAAREPVDAGTITTSRGSEGTVAFGEAEYPLCRKLRPARRSFRPANLLPVARASLRGGQARPHIGPMNLDLTDEETAALTQELHDIVENDRYPFSPRIRTLRAILNKLRPEPVREPLPPLRVYAPPRATAARRRFAGR